MSVTLSKLSLRNARRQARDYLVYFVTTVLSAALLYAFNGLVFSGELQELSHSLKSLPLVVTLASIAAVCIMGWLVSYTTSFMLSRRSRELGTYILMGLENRQAARLFFLENLAVGAVALTLGILLGNLIYQILRALILALFHTRYTFGFAFSLRAIGLTLVYFSLIYLSAQFRNHKRIRSMKIYDLIYFERRNEEAVIKKSSTRRKLFPASIGLGTAGTLLLLLRNLPSGICGAGCIILSLYGFFISFSSGVPAWFQKHPWQKYQGQTLLIFRTLSAKLAAMGVVMATTALLFTAVLISQGTGLTFSAMFQKRAQQTTCFDLFIGSSEENQNLDDYLDYISTGIPTKNALQYQLYLGETRQITDYVTQSIRTNDEYYGYYERDLLMKFSDYTALRSMLGYEKVTLENGQYLVHCMPFLKDTMTDYDHPVSLNGSVLKPGPVYTESFTQYTWQANGHGFLIIVPDEAAESCTASHRAYAAMTKEPVSEAQFQALTTIQESRTDFDSIFAKSQAENEWAAATAMFVFPLYYLALILTMTAAAILTIQQLSETGRYQRQFLLLQKLGMERREMERVLRRQLAIYYLMPAVPPLLIGIPFILSLGGAVEPGILVGASHPLIIAGTTVGLFFTIYFIYILIAYTSLKRNVLALH